MNETSAGHEKLCFQNSTNLFSNAQLSQHWNGNAELMEELMEAQVQLLLLNAHVISVTLR